MRPADEIRTRWFLVCNSLDICWLGIWTGFVSAISPRLALKTGVKLEKTARGFKVTYERVRR